MGARRAAPGSTCSTGPAGPRADGVDGPAFFAFHHVNAFDDGRPRRGPRRLRRRLGHRGLLPAPARGARRRGSRRGPCGATGSRSPAARSARRGALRRRRSSCRTWTTPRMNTSPEHRYVYGVGVRAERGFYDQLVKVDLEHRRTGDLVRAGLLPGRGRVRRTPGSGGRGRRRRALGRARRRARHVVPAGPRCGVLRRGRAGGASAPGAVRLPRPVLRRPARAFRRDPAGRSCLATP